MKRCPKIENLCPRFIESKQATSESERPLSVEQEAQRIRNETTGKRGQGGAVPIRRLKADMATEKTQGWNRDKREKWRTLIRRIEQSFG